MVALHHIWSLGALKITKQKETYKNLTTLRRICLAIVLTKTNYFFISFVQIFSDGSSRCSLCTDFPKIYYSKGKFLWDPLKLHLWIWVTLHHICSWKVLAKQVHLFHFKPSNFSSTLFNVNMLKKYKNNGHSIVFALNKKYKNLLFSWFPILKGMHHLSRNMFKKLGFWNLGALQHIGSWKALMKNIIIFSHQPLDFSCWVFIVNTKLQQLIIMLNAFHGASKSRKKLSGKN